MRFDASDLEFLRPLVLEAMQQLAMQIGAMRYSTKTGSP